MFDLFGESPVVRVMMNPDGTQNPIVYDGIGAIEEYFTFIFNTFSPIQFTDIRITTADNGRTAFVQANGAFTVEEAGSPYNNVYVLRFDINEAGQIVATEEYLNLWSTVSFWGSRWVVVKSVFVTNTNPSFLGGSYLRGMISPIII